MVGSQRLCQKPRPATGQARIYRFCRRFVRPGPGGSQSHRGRQTRRPDQVAAFEKEMRDGGVDWEVIVYGGAVHAFTNPDADKVGMDNIKYNEKADHRSWQAMRTFFTDVFNEPAKQDLPIKSASAK